MATDLNIVGLVGRLTKPCEMRYTNSGFAICSFSLAVNRKKKSPDGSWNDSVSFFDCSYFGKAAEGVSQYLTKGQQISIQGYLEQQSWETDGGKRHKVVVIVNSLSLLSKVGENKQNNGYQPPPQTQGQQRPVGQQQNQNQPQGQYQGQQKPQAQKQAPQGQQQGYQYQPNNYGQQVGPNQGTPNNNFKQPGNNFNNQPANGPEDFADDIPF